MQILAQAIRALDPIGPGVRDHAGVLWVFLEVTQGAREGFGTRCFLQGGEDSHAPAFRVVSSAQNRSGK